MPTGTIPTASSTITGTLIFGVICPTNLKLKFTFDKEGLRSECNVSVFVNGVQETGMGHQDSDWSRPDVFEPPLVYRADADPAGKVPRIAGGWWAQYVLPLTPNPCGNIIKIVGIHGPVSGGGATPGYIKCEILGYSVNETEGVVTHGNT